MEYSNHPLLVVPGFIADSISAPFLAQLEPSPYHSHLKLFYILFQRCVLRQASLLLFWISLNGLVLIS